MNNHTKEFTKTDLESRIKIAMKYKDLTKDELNPDLIKTIVNDCDQLSNDFTKGQIVTFYVPDKSNNKIIIRYLWLGKNNFLEQVQKNPWKSLMKESEINSLKISNVLSSKKTTVYLDQDLFNDTNLC